MAKKAVILFSGGLDSTTCIAIAKSQGFDCYALSFSYSQKHSIELERAKILGKEMGVIEHKIVTLELNGSALTDTDKEIPDFTGTSDIPVTYVPARNTVFLSIALSWAETLGALDIFIGANVVDYSHYPDCRPEFLTAFENVANTGTKVGAEGERFKIHAPLLQWSKAEIIQAGLKLGVDYGKTLSCYNPDAEGKACRVCDSCTFRSKGFREAGVADPTLYV